MRRILMLLSFVVILVFAASVFPPRAEAGCGNQIQSEQRTCPTSCGGGTVWVPVCNGVGGACRNWNDIGPCGDCTVFMAGTCVQGSLKPLGSRGKVQQASCRRTLPSPSAKQSSNQR